MERRDVLKFGALAGLGSSGCASLLSNPSAIGAGEMDGFLSTLDTALAAAGRGNLFESFLPAGSARSERTKRAEALTAKTLRSLLLVGTLHELPPDRAAHEGLQQRLRASMGEFDDAMFGMTSMLEGLTAAERADISKALAEDPGLGMRIMGAFDEEAAALGISFQQRTKLRGISSMACSRLRQGPGLVIDEYTGKVRKVAARHGARAAAERGVAAALGEALMWEEQGGTAGGVQMSGLSQPPFPGAPVACAVDSDCGDEMVCAGHRDLGDGKWSRGACTKPKRSGAGLLTAGGTILGMGALGALVVSLGGGGTLPFGLTIGAVLGVVGIVILIIGAIRSIP